MSDAPAWALGYDLAFLKQLAAAARDPNRTATERPASQKNATSLPR